jgi:hypothetical protein
MNAQEPQTDPIMPVAIIRKDLLAITGNKTQAMLLNQLLYWSERTRDRIPYEQEEILRAGGHDTGLTHGWIHRTMSQLGDELFMSAKTVARNVAQLMKAGFISAKKSTLNKWDNTTLYRVDKNAIESLLSASNPHGREQDKVSTSNRTKCPHRIGQSVRLSESIKENNIESKNKTPYTPPMGSVCEPEFLPSHFSPETGEQLASEIKTEMASPEQPKNQNPEGSQQQTEAAQQQLEQNTPPTVAPLPPRPAKMWDEPGFDVFWREYPRKVSKEKAKKAWNSIKPSPILQDEMLKAMAFQKTTWDNPRYIPHPATWLNGHRWEDELLPQKQQAQLANVSQSRKPDPREVIAAYLARKTA